MRPFRLAALTLSAALLTTGLTSGAAALASQACGASGAVTTLNGSLADGATYTIQCPAARWNGTLFLYSHGYVVPGSANPAQDVGDPVTGNWLLSHGYALAGFVDRAGHCAFTPAETISAVQTLLNRLGTGHWNSAALTPAALNAQAAALGPDDNIFSTGGSVSPAAPGFVRYQPAPYLRPFNLPPW